MILTLADCDPSQGLGPPHDDRYCAFMTLPCYMCTREDDSDARAAQVT
jgi:hypothetical protein